MYLALAATALALTTTALAAPYAAAAVAAVAVAATAAAAAAAAAALTAHIAYAFSADPATSLPPSQAGGTGYRRNRNRDCARHPEWHRRDL